MPSSVPSIRRGLLFTAAMLAAGILPFVLLEYGLRVAGYGYPTGFFVPVPGRQAFTSNQRFGWRFFPASMARTPVLAWVPAAREPRVYRIFILGDSAAMGIPEPAFGFGRMLRSMLENAFPDSKFQIVNTAMTAINSHVMVPIAEDSARLAPDLFVVLAGNNEVIGPYGPGTVLAGYSSSLGLIRSAVWFKSTRTAQWMENLLARVRHTETDREWQGMAMFTGRQVAADDPRLNSVRQNFRANLQSVAQIAQSAGAAVIVSTVPVNLKDTAPFASAHRPNLSAADESRWRVAYEDGLSKAREGSCDAALSAWERARQIDSAFADLRYRIGLCLLQSGRAEEARENLMAARDLDTLRFRADSRINEAIRDLAASDRRVLLVDAARDFPPLPGKELFYEHVHLRFEGNYLLARLMLPKVEAALRLPAQTGRPMSQAEVAADLGYSEWDRDKAEMDMLGLMLQAPFTPSPETEASLNELRMKWSSPRPTSHYETALRHRPDDLQLRELLAELLTKSGNFAAASKQYRWLLELIPDVASWRADLAYASLQQGDFAGAQTEAAAALRIEPRLPGAQFTLAMVAERQGSPDDALSRYEELLRTQPDYPDAHLRLAILLGRKQRYREAADHYLAYLKARPASPEAENNLGVILVRLGDIDAAIPHYAAALRWKPNFAEAANNMGVALQRRGKTQESAEYFRRALQWKPDFAEARAHLTQIGKENLNAR